MITKNEEANLQRCLDSILPIINMKDDDTLEPLTELIIVDTGSTDRTLNIARKFTDKIYEKKFIPWDFSKARNYGIKKAIGEWVMIIDADEELLQKSIYLLEDAVLNPKNKDINTIFVDLHNIYTNRGEYTKVIQARIFRNINNPVYEFSIHNKARAETPYLFMDTIIFNHYGYLFQKPDLFFQKKERSLPMLESEYKKNPDDLHILTHIIKTYYACNDFKNVVEKGNQWIGLMKSVEYHVGWFAYLEVFINVLSAHCALGDTKSAEKTLKESKKYTDKLIAMNLILGQHYLQVKKPAKARQLFEDAYMQSKLPSDPYEMLCSSNTDAVMPEIINLLALLEFDDGNFERSGQLINEGIKLNMGRLPLRWDIFNDPSAKKKLKYIPIKRKRSA